MVHTGNLDVVDKTPGSDDQGIVFHTQLPAADLFHASIPQDRQTLER
jgi:hypothetical protein